VIAGVRGVLRDKGRDRLTVSIGPLDLTVFVPASLLSSDLAIGDPVELYTHLHVREDDLSLYGFESAEQRELFTMLNTVNGIGPRTALSILSLFSTDVLITAIAEGKAEVLARAPGVGMKTAQKVVLQLQDKLESMRPAGRVVLHEADEDVIAALTGLGFSLVEAQRAVQLLPQEVTGVEERLRLALERFGGGKK
jgi:Holliday junction DNA helicase RuvA